MLTFLYSNILLLSFTPGLRIIEIVFLQLASGAEIHRLVNLPSSGVQRMTLPVSATTPNRRISTSPVSVSTATSHMATFMVSNSLPCLVQRDAGGLPE